MIHTLSLTNWSFITLTSLTPWTEHLVYFIFGIDTQARVCCCAIFVLQFMCIYMYKSTVTEWLQLEITWNRCYRFIVMLKMQTFFCKLNYWIHFNLGWTIKITCEISCIWNKNRISSQIQLTWGQLWPNFVMADFVFFHG